MIFIMASYKLTSRTLQFTLSSLRMALATM